MKKLLYFLLALPIMFAAESCGNGGSGGGGEECPEVPIADPDAIEGNYHVSYEITLDGEQNESMSGKAQLALAHTNEGSTDKISISISHNLAYYPELSSDGFLQLNINGIVPEGEKGNLSFQYDKYCTVLLSPGGLKSFPATADGSIKKIQGTRLSCEGPEPQSNYQQLDMTATITAQMTAANGLPETFTIVYNISPINGE